LRASIAALEARNRTEVSAGLPFHETRAFGIGSATPNISRTSFSGIRERRVCANTESIVDYGIPMELPSRQHPLLPLFLTGPGLFLLSLLWMARSGDGERALADRGRSATPLQSPAWRGPTEAAHRSERGIRFSAVMAKVSESSSLTIPTSDQAGWKRRTRSVGGSGAEGRLAADPTVMSPPAARSSGLDARDFEALEARHQEMVLRLLAGESEGALGTAEASVLLPEVCFSPGTRSEVIRSFAAARRLAEERRFDSGVRAAATQLASRWTETATISSGFARGDPTTLTWSIVPDGINIPGSGGGEASSPSNLRAWLDARYGNESVWLPMFIQVFQRWTELSGVTYVREPNDDGAGFPSSPGVLGGRGDIRISGHEIDGNFDILAYNYFPQQGDMVLDTADSFFADTSNDSRKLRTVLAHENGHGLGLKHVCPTNATKLMEPFISSAVSTPKLDDVYSIQRLYGDRFEPNNSRTAPQDLGTLAVGKTTLADLSIDDNNDADFYRFAPPHDGSLLSAILRPIGASYPEGAQNSDGSCSSGTTFNALTRHNLDLELRDADGTTVLVAADSQPAGEDEAFSVFPLPNGSGPFFLRIFPTTSTNNVQLYELELTLVDTATPRLLSVGDVTVNEGAGTATLTVSVTPSAGESIDVGWQPATHTAASDVDFAAAGGTAVIPAGAVSTSISVPIFDDALDENDETLLVQLAAPANAVLADGSAVVTISDDDPLPALTVAPGSTGESSGVPASFAAALSAPSGREIRVDWATGTGASTFTPAQPDQDYLPTAGTLLLAAGETTGVIGPVQVLDDALAEADETFDLNLTAPVNVVLAIPSVTGRIYDDEGPLALAQTGSFGAPGLEGHPVITWDGVIGRRYRVETSSDLLIWIPLPGDSTITTTQTSLSFVDTSVNDSPRKYYRVVDVPP
jgi:hypothetical protein